MSIVYNAVILRIMLRYIETDYVSFLKLYFLWNVHKILLLRMYWCLYMWWVYFWKPNIMPTNVFFVVVAFFHEMIACIARCKKKLRQSESKFSCCFSGGFALNALHVYFYGTLVASSHLFLVLISSFRASNRAFVCRLD